MELSSLLSHGTPVNETEYNRTPPLHWAAKSGHAEGMKLLLDGGASVNELIEDGLTPLLWAAKGGHAECVKLLLDWGANVNTADKDGRTPLHWAAKDGFVESVKLLLDNGANVNQADKDGRTPHYWAAKKGNTECVKLILNRNGDISLHWAAKGGHAECVKLLLDGGANVNQANNHGTPLHWAAKGGHAECVKLLLDGGANVNLIDDERGSPLRVAVKCDNAECVKLLLDWNAKVDFLVNENYIFSVLEWEDTSTSARLLSRFAEVFRFNIFKSNPFGMTNNAGHTALHLAVLSRRPTTEIATLLKAYPAAIKIQDCYGKSPLDLAEEFTEPQVLWLLLQYQSLGFTSAKYPLLSAVTKMTKRVIQSVHIHLIGHGYAGKTTCRLALTKSLATSNSLKFTVFGSHGDVSVDRSDDSGKTKGMESDVIESKYRTWIIKDYGGQEDFHVNHARFLVHPGSVYLIVVALWNEEAKKIFAVNEIESRLLYWLKFLNSIVEPGRVLNCIIVVNFAKKVDNEFLSACLRVIRTVVSNWRTASSSIVFIGEPCVLSVNKVKEVRQLLSLLESSSISLEEKSFPVMTYVTAVEIALETFVRLDRKIVPNSVFVESVCFEAIKSLLKSDSLPTEDQHIDFVCRKMISYLSAVGKILVVPSVITDDPLVVLDLRWLSKTLLGSLINRMSGTGMNEMLLSTSEINELTNNGKQYFNGHEDELVAFLESIGACIVVRDNSTTKTEIKRWFPLCSQRKFVAGVECLPLKKDMWISYRKIARIFTLADPKHQMFPPGYFLDIFLKALSLFTLSKLSKVKVFINGLDVEFQTSSDSLLQVLLVVHDDNCGFTSEINFVSRLKLSPDRGECWRSFNKLCEIIMFPKNTSSSDARQSPWFDNVKLVEVFVNPRENLFGTDHTGKINGINLQRTKKILPDLQSLDKAMQDLHVYGCDETGMPVDEASPPNHIFDAMFSKLDSIEQQLIANWNRVEVTVSSEMIEDTLKAMLMTMHSTSSSKLQAMIETARGTLRNEFGKLHDIQSEVGKLRLEIASQVSCSDSEILKEIKALQGSVEELSSEVKNIQHLNDKVLQQSILKVLDESKTLHKLDSMMQTVLKGRHDIPTMALIIPVVDHSLLISLNPSNIINYEYSLFFICCHTHEVVPSGPDGKGFRFRRPKEWFKKVAPVVKYCLIAAKIALTISGIPIPINGAVESLNDLSSEVASCTLYLDTALNIFDKVCDVASKVGVTQNNDGASNSKPVDEAEAFIASIPELLKQSETEEAYRMIKDVLGDGLSSVHLQQVTSEKGHTGWVKKGDQAVIDSFKRDEKWPMQIAALRNSYSTAANSSSSSVSGSSGGGQSRLGASRGLWLPKSLFGHKK